jgi:hypothetical protein
MHVIRLGDALPNNAAKPFDGCTLHLQTWDAHPNNSVGPRRSRSAAAQCDATLHTTRCVTLVSAGADL